MFILTNVFIHNKSISSVFINKSVRSECACVKPLNRGASPFIYAT